jgi:ribosomal-protein-alanine N-acetyltransferase
MSNINIRQATKDDIDKLIALDELSFTKSWSFQMFSDEIKKDYAYFYLAEIDNIPVGYAIIWCIYETAELIRIATHPDYRKKGIGNSLIKKALEKAIEQKCETMMLEVNCNNTAAQALYLKNNFRQISIRKGYYDGEDAVIMQIILQN